VLGLTAACDPDVARAVAATALANDFATIENAICLHALLDLPLPEESRALYGAMDHATCERGSARRWSGAVIDSAGS
jgi:hypothetical protein